MLCLPVLPTGINRPERNDNKYAMEPKDRLTLAVLCTVPFVMVLGNSMLIPLLPAMKQAMGLNPFQTGLLITAFSLPAGLTIPLAGFLSDRLGRKTVMSPALALYGVGGLTAGLAAWAMPHPYPLVLIGRIIQGLGAGGTYQLAMALAGDIFQTPERARAMGTLEASNGLGKMVSPLLGSLAGLISWFAVFFVYGAAAFPAALATWLTVKEPPLKQPLPSLSGYTKKIASLLATHWITITALLFGAAAALFALFGLLSYLSDVLEAGHGIKGLKLGFLIAIPTAITASVAYGTGMYMGKKKNTSQAALSMVISLAVLALATALNYILSGPVLPLILVSIIGLTTGVILPTANMLVTSIAPKEERGIITCLYGAARFFGVALGPPFFGLPTETIFLAGAAFPLVASAVALGSYLRRPRPSPERS